MDQELRRFLSQAYELKLIADFFNGPSDTISAEGVAEAVETSKRFVAHFVGLQGDDARG